MLVTPLLPPPLPRDTKSSKTSKLVAFLVIAEVFTAAIGTLAVSSLSSSSSVAAAETEEDSVAQRASTMQGVGSIWAYGYTCSKLPHEAQVAVDNMINNANDAEKQLARRAQRQVLDFFERSTEAKRAEVCAELKPVVDRLAMSATTVQHPISPKVLDAVAIHVVYEKMCGATLPPGAAAAQAEVIKGLNSQEMHEVGDKIDSGFAEYEQMSPSKQKTFCGWVRARINAVE
jgi:hypothetical protein